MYWFPRLKKELENKGYPVEAPQMPNPLIPKINEWVSLLSKIVGTPDENTFFFGHSLGCQAILRFVETLPEGTKVGGAIFVAPFIVLSDLEREIVRPWVETPIDFEKVKKILPKSTAIFSDDDPLIPIDNRELFEKKLGSKTILLKRQNHFVTIKNFPYLLDEINELLF